MYSNLIVRHRGLQWFSLHPCIVINFFDCIINLVGCYYYQLFLLYYWFSVLINMLLEPVTVTQRLAIDIAQNGILFALYSMSFILTSWWHFLWESLFRITLKISFIRKLFLHFSNNFTVPWLYICQELRDESKTSKIKRLHWCTILFSLFHNCPGIWSVLVMYSSVDVLVRSIQLWTYTFMNFA